MTLGPGEKELVLKISSRFDLDQVQAFLLLRAFLRSDQAASLTLPPPSPPSSSSAPATSGGDPSASTSSATVVASSPSSSSLSTDLLDHFNLFYFRERLAVLNLVAALLRAVENDDHEYYDVAHAIVSKLLPSPSASTSSTTSSPPFVERLFRQFITHARTPIPSHILSLPSHSPLWAKQLLKEQLAILEVIFLVLYSFSATQSDPATTEGILLAAHASDYGASQANSRLLRDTESEALLGAIRGMLVIVCVEVLDLETLIETPATSSLPSSPSSVLSSPTHLLSLHEHFLTVQPSATSSPVLIAWSYVLSRLTDSLAFSTPEAFIPLAEVILPEEGQQPAWQTLVGRALGGNGDLFRGLTKLMRGRLFVDVEDGGEGGANVELNALGHRSVMKGQSIFVTPSQCIRSPRLTLCALSRSDVLPD